MRHGCGHLADRSGTRDEDVLADQVEGQCRVHSVPQRVEDRRRVIADLVGHEVGVSGRQDDAIGEATVSVDAHPDGRPAQVGCPCPAVPTGATRDVAFPGDAVALPDPGHLVADLDGDPDELVSDGDRRRQGRFRPVIPVVDVEVGPTDGGAPHLDHDIGRTGDRFRYVGQYEAGLSFRLDQGPHGVPPTRARSPAACTKAATAESMSSVVCAALIWVRIRA